LRCSAAAASPACSPAGAHELRLFRATYLSDTHVFYVRPEAWWAEAERLYPAAVERCFQRIDDTLDFP
jgi:hypothetical protein